MNLRRKAAVAIVTLRHREQHRTARIGWLRAAVLGANDGIVSTASLVIGVAAAHATRSEIMVAGVAGLTAGALSMAAGEYVSVGSQADTEHADLERERGELALDSDAEDRELAGILRATWRKAGALAQTVAHQLMAHDALAAHARDELGISEHVAARPLQAALASATAFAVGAALPILTIALAPPSQVSMFVAGVSLISGRARRARRPHGRRSPAHRRGARGLLGSARDGGHGRRRMDVWRGRLNRPCSSGCWYRTPSRGM